MDEKEILENIQRLRENIRENSRLYYVENTPVISDFEFDMLMQELIDLEEQYPQFITPDSPTQIVGSDLAAAPEQYMKVAPATESVPEATGPQPEQATEPEPAKEPVRTTATQAAGPQPDQQEPEQVKEPEQAAEPAVRTEPVKKQEPAVEQKPVQTTQDGFEQYPHRYPMLSLGNTYNIAEIEEFADRATKSIGGAFTYCCELKFDGTAICLTYRNGVLVRALTRGDGVVGDDVSANVKHISNIPQKLSGFGWPEEFEIRGEIYMPYEAFNRLNEEKVSEGEQPFANPRNAASGSLKLTDPSQVAHRGLECTLYHIPGEDLNYHTHDQALRAAMKWGLPVSDKRRICRNIIEIEEYIKYWDTARKSLPFATDGIVIKINELPYQQHLGYTSKFPRWAVAFKFKAEQALTRVCSIDFQVGRTGAVTPVANLEPVQLSGTIVKRATLHNNDQIDSLDIRVGDYVYVEKGGEIIPKITSVELSRREGDLPKPSFPELCPDCGTPLVRDEGEAKWFCPNTDGCPTQIQNKLVHFLSRKAMNVIAGDATVEQLYNLGLVRCPADFYSLTANDLMRLDGWKDRAASRFLDSLEDSKHVTFDHVLFALGIRYVGETTAKTIARHFGDIDSIMAAGKDELLAVGDVGDVIADSIVSYFSDSRHRDEVARLRDAGLQFSFGKVTEKASDALEGLTFVVSGNFTIAREQLKKIIEDNGGRNSGSISSKTSYLLAGEKPGPEKVRKARSLDVKIISEVEFYTMLPEGARTADDGKADSGEQHPVQLSLF